jgi:hypothetical protein
MNVKELSTAHFIPLVRTHMRCSPAYQHRIIQILESNDSRNVLFDTFIRPNLFVPNLDQHIPVHQGKYDYFSDIHSKALDDSLQSKPLTQIDYSHFSNTLRVPAYGPDGRGAGPVSYGWEPPTPRAAIGLFWVFTFETDPTDASGFQTQLEWVWQKGSDGITPLGRLDAYLRKNYQDYRGYTVVWSGNKSVHIHLIFDTTHLSREASLHAAMMANTDPDHRLKNWSEDIREDSIWEYHKDTWMKLAGLMKTQAGISAEFDKAMKPLHQKRRMPWAIRLAEEGNYHEFPVDTWIPQIVLDERLVTTRPKGALGWLLSAAEANAMPSRMPTHRVRGHRPDLSDDPDLRDAMINYLAAEWGHQYPKPAIVEWDDGYPRVYFYNHAGDIHASTFLGSGHSRLVYRGAGAPSSNPAVAQLPRGMSLDDLVFVLEEQMGRGVPAPPQGLSAPFRSGRNLAVLAHYRHAKDRTVNGNRAGLRQAVSMQLEAKPFSMIVTAEGGGKSSTLLDTAIDYRWNDFYEAKFPGRGLVKPNRGLHVFACMANVQAEEQFLNFVEKPGNENHAVLLFSFSEHYQQANDHRRVDETWEYITYDAALSSGFNSQLDAVFANQPAVYHRVTAEMRQGLTLPNGQSAFDNVMDVIFFTSHALAQDLNQISKSKAWLHPDFRPDMTPEEWMPLAETFTVYRLIHDEISVEDLLWIATEEEVAFARRVRRSVKGWDQASASTKYRAYADMAHNKPKDMTFHRFTKIDEARFKSEDQVAVDFKRFQFGVENSDDSMFKATDGQVVYLKPKDWWQRLRARIVITTTERLPVEVIRALPWTGYQGRPERFVILPLDREETFPVEHLSVELNADASKSKVQGLVTRLLNDPDDPVDAVITNYATGTNIYSHKAARGRNDLAEKNIATILTFMGSEQYSVLNCIGQKFDIRDPIGLSYRDMLNQDVGRNRGFRSTGPTPGEHRLIVSPRLYRCLGGQRFFGSGRYRFTPKTVA